MSSIIRKLYQKGDNYIKSINFPEELTDKVDMGIPLEFKRRILLTMENEKNRMTDVLMGDTTLVIVSKNFYETLLEVEEEKNIEFIPVEFTQKSFENRKYGIMNILNNINGMNMKLSEYQLLPPFLLEKVPPLKRIPKIITKLVLNPTDRHVFRIREQPTAILCSQVLTDLIKKRAFSGIELRKLEDFTDIFYVK